MSYMIIDDFKWLWKNITEYLDFDDDYLKDFIDNNTVKSDGFILYNFSGKISEISKLEKILSIIEHTKIPFMLDLSKNHLISLPNKLCDLENMTCLNLRNCTLKDIPDEIGKLSNLDILYLEHNNLVYLPTTIGNLSKLRQLYLNDNIIEQLPKEIGNLISLNKLSLEVNNLNTLPDTIGNLKELKDLYLSNNPIEEIPLSVAKLKSLSRFSRFNIAKYRITRVDTPKETIQITPPSQVSKHSNLTQTLINNNNFHFDEQRLSIRNNALNIQGNRCQDCGSINDLDVHHILPRNMGGKDIISNLKVLCRKCHEGIHPFSITNYNSTDNKRGNSGKINIIQKAIQKGLKLKITYHKEDKDNSVNIVTTRIITPGKLYYENHRQYLEAYCYLRNDRRCFRISRIAVIDIA